MRSDLNALLTALQSDEPDAMANLVTELRPRLAGFFIRNNAPDTDIDDLIQTVLIKLWRLKDRFRPKTQTASPYIRQMAMNCLRDHMRTIGRQRRGGGRDRVSLKDVDVPDDAESAQVSLERSEVRDTVKAVVRGLRGPVRQVCRMQIAGVSKKQIAADEGCRQNTVHRHFQTAFERLRRNKRLKRLVLQ